MIDPVDISEGDPRIKEVAEILLKAGELGVYSAARAAIAWHENQKEPALKLMEKAAVVLGQTYDAVEWPANGSSRTEKMRDELNRFLGIKQPLCLT